MRYLRAVAWLGMIALVVGFVFGGVLIPKPKEPLATAPTASNGETATEIDSPAVVTKAPTVISIQVAKELENGFPKSLTIHEAGRTFQAQYTGQFTRVRKLLIFPVKVYTIASYVEAPNQGDTQGLLDSLLTDGPRKVYVLRFLRSLTGKQILGAIREEIDLTFDDVDMVRLQSNIDRFCENFANGSSPGDLVYIAWLPGGRLCTSFNKPEHVEMIAEDIPLTRAIWRIWAGANAGAERVGLVERYANRPGPK